jgi:hypothetical protein
MTINAQPAVHVYCGPTITADEVLDNVPGAYVHPPVQHGDLLSLGASRGDTVLIIDGVFHHAAATRHKEILDLLASGVHVVGAASMGALRAAELHCYGMIGVGSIFSAYRDEVIDADDEVAVAHTPDDHKPLSEALVDIRAIVGLAMADGALCRSEAEQIIDHARGVHYTDRTWTALLCAPIDADLAPALQRLASWHASHPGVEGAKHADAVAALRLVAGDNLPSASTQRWIRQPWRTYHVRHWIARYRGRVVDGFHVPFLAMLQHQQLYDPAFPARWRRHVLAWIAGAVGPPTRDDDRADVESLALATAEVKGIALRYLSAAQLEHWLTRDELKDLPNTEKLTRVLVRSVIQDPDAAIWPTSAYDAPDLFNPAIDSASAAASAFQRNEEVARSGPHRTVYELRADKVREHVAERWGISPDDEQALMAAARDRGFHSAAGAVEAARSFILSAISGPADRDYISTER